MPPNGDVRLSEPGTSKLPSRTYSGAKIKTRVVSAMAEQQEVFRECSKAADKLMEVLRKADSLPPGPRT